MERNFLFAVNRLSMARRASYAFPLVVLKPSWRHCNRLQLRTLLVGQRYDGAAVFSESRNRAQVGLHEHSAHVLLYIHSAHQGLQCASAQDGVSVPDIKKVCGGL